MALHPFEVVDGPSGGASVLILATLVFVLFWALTVVFVRRRLGATLSLSFLLFWGLLLVHGIPLLIYIYLTGPETFIFEKALEFVDRDLILAQVMVAIAVMLACLVAGFELTNLMAPRWQRRAVRESNRNYDKEPVKRVVKMSLLHVILGWLLVTMMLAVSIYQSHVSNIAEFFYFGAAGLDKDALRRDVGGTPFYVYNVVLNSIAPYLVMVSFCNDVGSRKKRWPRPLTVALFGVVLLGKFGTLSKAPPLIFLLQLLLLGMLLKNPTINAKSAIKFSLVALLLSAIISSLTFSELRIGEIMSFLYYRIFDIPNEVILEYFSAIPASIAHTWGQSMLGWFSEGQSPLATYYAVAELTRNSVLSTSNSMFIGDAWAQFSWVGVAAVSCLVGFVFRLVDLYGLRGGYTDQSACLIAGCSYAIVTVLTTSFTTALITGGLALIPPLASLFVRRRRVLKQVPQTSN